MRNRLTSGLFGFVVMMLGGIVAGTAAAQVPPFSVIGTPTSPAFTLLDVGASTIERPRTPADFAVKLGNATQQLSALPQQFAVEVAPYWLLGHSRLTWSDDAERDVVQSLARTLVFSTATAPLGSADEALTGLAVSLSASPFSGRLSDDTRESIRGLEATLSSISAQFDARVRDRREALRDYYAPLLSEATTPSERERLREELETRSAALNEAVRGEIAEEIVERLAPYEGFEPRRVGFFMTIAGGVAWAFRDAILDQGTLAQWGMWGTVSYRRGPWSPTLVLRYLDSKNDIPMPIDLPEGEAMDLGAQLIYSKGPFGFSVEYVLRRSLADDTMGHRLVGTLDYGINEKLWLIASFGRDHDTSAEGSLVAQLGLAFNFSRDRYSLPR